MSKYMEEEQYLNYGNDSKCEECETLKLKLNRKVNSKQITIDNLERKLRDWKDAHWKLVGINCKLQDKIKVLEGTDTIV